jgi:hypothetical protein
VKGLGASESENRGSFEAWLKKDPCDTVVFIDVPAGTLFDEGVRATDYEHLGEWLENQTAFVRTASWHLSGSIVTLWQRP